MKQLLLRILDCSLLFTALQLPGYKMADLIYSCLYTDTYGMYVHLHGKQRSRKLLYDQLLAGLRKGYKEDKIQTGVFGAMMQVGAL